MSDISKINPNGTEYNLKDAAARQMISNLDNAVNELESGLIDVNSNIANLVRRDNVTNTTQSNGALQVINSSDYLPIGFVVTDKPNDVTEVGGYFLLGGDGAYYLMCKSADGTPIANKQLSLQVAFVSKVTIS